MQDIAKLRKVAQQAAEDLRRMDARLEDVQAGHSDAVAALKRANDELRRAGHHEALTGKQAEDRCHRLPMELHPRPVYLGKPPRID